MAERMEQFDIAGLVAREAIRDLVARYNVAGDSGRIDDMLVLFAEDAVLEVDPGRRYCGRGEIRTLFEGARDPGSPPHPIRFLRHFVTTHQIDLAASDAAHGRCYFAVLTDAGLDHWGRYIDDYALCEGRWRFRARKVVVDAMVPGGWGERSQRRLAADK